MKKNEVLWNLASKNDTSSVNKLILQTGLIHTLKHTLLVLLLQFAQAINT